MKIRNRGSIGKIKLLVGTFMFIVLMNGVLAFDTYINNSNIFVNGGLGVGTQTPSQTLSVNGTFAVRNNTGILGLFQSVLGRIGIGMSSPSQTLSVNGTFAVRNNGTLGLFQNVNGSVGIGTTSPLTKLQINGSVTSLGSIHARDDLDGLKLENGIVRKWYNSSGTAPNTEDEMKAFFVDSTTALYRVSTESNISYSTLGDGYAMEFVGYIYANTSGVYTFNTNSDDASDVHLDGVLVSDYYGSHGNTFGGSNGTVWLEKGFHKVVYRHVEGSGGDAGDLRWMVPGSSTMVTIPSAHYYFDVSRNCPIGWWSAAYGRLCMEQTERGAATMPNAITACRGIQGGARVCSENDFNQICGTGVDPFTNNAGWMYDTYNDDTYKVWNVVACSDNLDGPPIARTNTRHYHCCI